MDYVYTCRPGDNEELRYSIRSVVKNASHDEIWVVGYKPDWYVGNFISVEDEKTKFWNIQRSLEIIAHSNDISDYFVWMNDDFYFTEWVGRMPIYHGGLLSDKINNYSTNYGNNQYTEILSDAYQKLKKNGISNPLDYDIHVPMVFEKEKLKSIVNLSLAPRSMYGNMFNVGGTQIKDVKIYAQSNIVSNAGMISSEDDSFYRIFKNYLKDLFTEPSCYEKE